MDTKMDYFAIVAGMFEDWADHRVWTPEEAKAAMWYLVYLFDEQVKLGAEWTGFSVSQRDGLCLMVSRRVWEGTPQVVFTTGRTTTDCMRLFRRAWERDGLVWVRDKYR